MAVQVRGVSHAYDRVPVLRDVSLEIGAGERVLVIGANGAGKSTLARVVAGLISPLEGSVSLFGRDVTGWRAHAVARMGLRYVPAYRSVFPYLSVEDNLELGAETMLGQERSRPNRTVLAERKDVVLAMFPALADKLKAPALRLSGGMQRMVEVGRALMGKPEVLILDEPSLGLAGGAVNQMAEGLAGLRNTGMTVVIIEQNVPFVTSICERGYLMSAGEITLAGSAEDLLNSAEVRKTYLGVI